ncbi:MAG: flagellar hook-basal body complex protein FliE [Myxococcota bacterium]
MIDELRSGLASLSDALGTKRAGGTDDAAKAAGGGARFADALGDAISSADQDFKAAEEEVRQLAQGKGDIVETMIGITRSELSLGFVVQLRNRALEAYQEIMRLPL